MLLAQITDTHVLEPDETGLVDNNSLLAETVAALNAEDPRPAAVVGTGDLVNWERPGQYEQLAALVAPLEMPFLPLVGNHDDRDLMRRTFPAMPWVEAEHASWSTVVEGNRIVGLDTTTPGAEGGAVDDSRLGWLEATLAASTEPVVLALHHPPFATGISWMDASGFDRLDELVQVIGRHQSTVIRIVCGHIHRPVTATVAGVTTSVCPSTVHHVALDLDGRTKPNLILDPRGYQLHLVEGGQVVTHTRYIDTGADAFEPEWA